MKKEEDLALSPKAQREKDALRRLAILEDLAAKKASVYGKLLTDMRLADEMQKLSKNHEERKTLLVKLSAEVGGV